MKNIHYVHEVCGSIRESKGHHSELKLPIPSHESCLWNITLSNLHLMIARSEINLGDILGSSKLIKQIINPRQGVLVLDGDCVQVPVINTHSHRAILLLNKQNRGSPG